jgi:large subunit ribosomal protein L15
MMLSEITAEAGGHKKRKRVGRGEGSGHGKTCGRGNKGCQSRAGGGTRPLHEGGQMPIFRRLPKRGFSNFHFAVNYQVVNLADLESRFAAGEKVDARALKDRGMVPSANEPVKILGSGALTKKLSVRVHAVSAAARQALEQAGGQIELIAQRDRAALAKAKRNTMRAAKKSGKPAGAAPTAS